MNIDDRAKELGLKVYDTALPQEWVDMIKREFGLTAYGHFVWCYDEAKIFGEPIPLDEYGWVICYSTGIKPRAIKEEM